MEEPTSVSVRECEEADAAAEAAAFSWLALDVPPKQPVGGEGARANPEKLETTVEEPTVVGDVVMVVLMKTLLDSLTALRRIPGDDSHRWNDLTRIVTVP